MTSRQPYRRISMTLPIARRNIDTKSGEQKVDDTPPPGLPSEESTAEIISDEFKCPICMNLYLIFVYLHF